MRVHYNEHKTNKCLIILNGLSEIASKLHCVTENYATLTICTCLNIYKYIRNNNIYGKEPSTWEQAREARPI